MKPIDLGREYDSTLAISMPPEKDMKEKHYPCLHIDGGPELAGIPDEGVMTITFKRVSLERRDRNGVKTCCVTLEVKSIDNVKEEDAPEEYERTKAEKAFDAAAKEVEDEEGEETE